MPCKRRGFDSAAPGGGAVDNLGALADDGRRSGVHSTCCARVQRGARTTSGSWLPEPVVMIDDSTSPEDEALIADSVGLALLVVLDTLTPSERLAFVLRDMFAVPFDEIARDP